MGIVVGGFGGGAFVFNQIQVDKRIFFNCQAQKIPNSLVPNPLSSNPNPVQPSSNPN